MANNNNQNLTYKIGVVGAETVTNTLSKIKAGIIGTGDAASFATGKIAALFGGIAIGATIKKIEDTNEAIKRLSMRVGVSTQFLSAMRSLANQTGLEFGELGDAISEIPKAIAEANAGDSGKIEAFARLRLDYKALADMIKEGNMEGAITTILTQIGRLKAGPSLIKGVSDLLGDSGAKMISTLQDLANNGFGYYAQMAKKSGNEVTDEMGNNAIAFNKAFRSIGQDLTGAANQIMTGMFPALEELAGKIDITGKDNAKNFRDMGVVIGQVAKLVVTYLKTMGSAVQTFMDVFTLLPKNLGYALGQLKNVDWSLLKNPDDTQPYYTKDASGKVIKTMITNRELLKKQLEGVDTAVWGNMTKTFDDLEKSASNFGQDIYNATADTLNFANAVDTARKKADELYAPPTDANGRIMPGQASAGAVKPTPGAPLSDLLGTTGNESTARDINPQGLAQATAQAQAKLAFVQATNQKELQFLQLKLDSAAKLDDEAYANGLLAYNIYADNKISAIKQASDKELQSITDQITAQQEVLKNLQAQAEIDPNQAVAIKQTENAIEGLRSDLLLKQKETTNKILDIEIARRGVIKAATEELKAFNAEQEQAIGNQLPRLQLDLDERLKKLKQILLNTGATADEMERQLAAAKSLGEAQIASAQAKDNFDKALQQYELDKSKIETYGSSGAAEAILAEDQLLKLQKERLATLQQLADAQLAAAQAAKDPAQIAAAEQQKLAVEQIAISVKKSDTAYKGLQDTLVNSGTNGLKDFFMSLVTDSRNAGQAFKNFVSGVVMELARWATQMMATYIIKQLLMAAGGAANGGMATTGGVVGGAKDGGFIGTRRYAVGGYTRQPMGGMLYGPGTPTSDSIPILVSNREFIVRNKAVETPGAVAFLNEFNKQGMPYLNKLIAQGQYADGGIIGAADFANVPGTSKATDGATEVKIGLEQGLVLQHLKTPEGRKVVADIMSADKKLFKNLLR